MTPRTSAKYPGLRVRQMPGGAYQVERSRDGARYIVFNDPAAHIGSPQRWHCVRRDAPTTARMTARTKDDLMRALASQGGDVRIVAA